MGSLQRFAASDGSRPQSKEDEGSSALPDGIWRAIFRASRDAILVTDQSFRYIEANDAACELLGAERSFILGKTSAAFTPKSFDITQLRVAFAERGQITTDYPIQRLDGSIRIVEISSVADVLYGVHVAVLRDVTDRRAQEAALRESELRLRAVLDNAPVTLFAIDTHGVFTFAAGKGLAAPGSTEQLVGQRTSARFASLPRSAERIRRALAGEQVEDRIEYGPFVLDLRMGPLSDASGKIIGAIGVASDVTEKVRLEHALARREQKYRHIVEGVSEGIWVLENDGRTRFVNAPMATLLGVAPEVAPTLSLESLVGAGAARQVRELLDGEGTDGARLELELVRPDGTPRWVELRTKPIVDPSAQRDGLIVVVTDSTEKRRNEGARAHAAAVFEWSADAIFALDHAGFVTAWNRSAARLYGYSEPQALGMHAARLWPHGARDLGRVLARALAGDPIEQTDTAHLRADGTQVEVALSLAPLRDASGNVQGVSAIARDLTRQRLAEAQLRQTEEQLRHSQKMEAIGSLAGGIAHDFNNILSAILSYAQIVLEELPEGDPLCTEVAEIERAGQRAAELTRQLLAFSRRQHLEPRNLELAKVVQGVERMLRRTLGERIQLSLALGPTSGVVHADPGQLEQVLVNLVVNARDAMPSGGAITIETYDVDLAAPDVRLGVPAGAYAMISVRDTGEGMDAATRARIFEPFFTTKEQGRGTGLGLSTVLGIVQQSGGYLRVESQPGSGSTFEVYLPRRPGAATVDEKGPVESAGGTETILLTEDDPQVRAVTRALLERRGYTVLEAEDGAVALALCERRTLHIDLLITDLVMPRLNGPLLARRARILRPGLRVLFMTGHTQRAADPPAVLEVGADVVQKPFSPQALLARVRSVLDRGH